MELLIYKKSRHAANMKAGRVVQASVLLIYIYTVFSASEGYPTLQMQSRCDDAHAV
jgi:hypothetical protein